MKTTAMPYAHYDGIPTLRDSDIVALWERMREDGTTDIVFYDGIIDDQYKFLAYMKSSRVQLFIGKIEGKTMGFGWLSHIEAKMARIHFCVFKRFWGAGVHSIVNRFASDILRQTGLDIIMGIIPSWNVKATKYVEKCGYTILGEMPFGCVDKHGNSHPATIVYYERGN